jgi:Holliday junction resolvase
VSNRGHQRERDWVHRLREQGFWAQRAPASLGIDVIASSPSLDNPDLAVLHFYEVKSTQGGPYSHFLPAERRAMVSQARRAGASAFLVWWPLRKEPKVIPECQWPVFAGRSMVASEEAA